MAKTSSKPHPKACDCERCVPRLSRPSKAELEILRQKAVEAVAKDPKKAATILTLWIQSASKQKKSA